MRNVNSTANPLVWLLAMVIGSSGLASGFTAEYSIEPLSATQAKEYGLDAAFYKKATQVQGILIATSARVVDLAHLEAAYQFDLIMKSIQPDVAERIRDSKVLCILIGHQELTSEVPQFATDKTGKELDFYNWRQRGFLTRINGRPTVVFAEEDVLEYEGGMQLESILIHEFGHVVHGAGFDRALQDRLTNVFQRARAKGIWRDGRAAQRFRRVKSERPVRLLDALVKSFPQQPLRLIRKCLDEGDILVNGKPTNSRVQVTRKDKVLIVFGGEKECYAHKNRAEYWAEGVQCWYDTNRTMDHDHNHIHTREQLKAYDPALASLCKDVLGESKLRFVSPRNRAGKGHLEGFDPSNSPKVVDPAHIQKAANDYYDKYWKVYWQRLSDKHALAIELKKEGANSLAQAARERGSAVRGAILFPQQELNCVNCHIAGGRNLLGPDLNGMGEEATDIYLAEAMLFPSKVIAKGFESVAVTTVAGKIHSGRIVEESPDKLVLRSANGNRPLITLLKTDVDEVAPSKTSSMPDALVDQLADRQQFLDLLRYLMELKASASRPVEAAVVKSSPSKLSEELTGLVLMDELQCHACHGDLGAKSMAPAKQAPKLAWANGRVNPKYIERFIADPEHVKPGTTMPDVMAGLAPDLRRKAAREITHYLSSLSKAKFRTQPLDVAAAHFGGELFHSVGCVACHSPRAENGAEKLRNESVPLGSINRKYNLDGLVAFLEDPHVVRPSGRMPNMTLTHWEAVSIANYLLGGPADREPTTEFQVDRSLAEKGKVQFAQLGCAQCHLSGGDRPERVYSTFANVQAEKGCLSGDVGEWPRYKLDESQLKAIRVAIKREPKELTKQEQLAVTLATFNCTVCHQRGNLGGVSGERDQYFQTANPNLGPQGRVPPRLTAVGAKLKPKWTRQVLVSGRKIRPYMKTRMPQYGTDNVAHLADLFQSIDQLSKTEFAEFSDQKQMRNDGHKLAGTDGLNCVACHNFQQKPATTMPGVDLTEMAERLQQNWFYHYMRAPQQLSTNTVMPSFWPGGRAIRKDVLDGDPDQQIEALWQYLLDGRQARAPRGLVREPILLVAADEAVILRRNYSGIGKRGIGVGFPGQVNLAFDAEQMRLAMIWKGDFADPGSAWRGQGSGSVRPLGSDLIRLSAGPNVDNATAPWAVDPGRPPKHRFKGYYLDDLQRPTFMYRFDGIDVEDYSIDEKDSESGAAFIRRTLTFGSEVKREDVAFWSATDQDIMMEADGSFLIGKKLRIRVVGKQRGGIVKAMKGGRLRIPLTLPKGTSKLVLDYSW